MDIIVLDRIKQRGETRWVYWGDGPTDTRMIDTARRVFRRILPADVSDDTIRRVHVPAFLNPCQELNNSEVYDAHCKCSETGREARVLVVRLDTFRKYGEERLIATAERMDD